MRPSPLLLLREVVFHCNDPFPQYILTNLGSGLQQLILNLPKVRFHLLINLMSLLQVILQLLNECVLQSNLFLCSIFRNDMLLEPGSELLIVTFSLVVPIHNLPDVHCRNQTNIPIGIRILYIPNTLRHLGIMEEGLPHRKLPLDLVELLQHLRDLLDFAGKWLCILV